MPLIDWDDKLNAGITFMDTEHKTLVALINRLHEAMIKGKSRDVIGPVLHELADYTVTHFGNEEGKMRLLGYPDFFTHKTEHQKFIDRVTTFKKAFDAEQVGVSLDLMTFLRDWLVNHIQTVDKKMAAFFGTKGMR